MYDFFVTIKDILSFTIMSQPNRYISARMIQISLVFSFELALMAAVRLTTQRDGILKGIKTDSDFPIFYSP